MRAHTLPLVLLGSALLGGALLAPASSVATPTSLTRVAIAPEPLASTKPTAAGAMPLASSGDPRSADALQPTAAPKRLLLPDGTSAELLNGVVEELSLSWPDDTPFSPIVQRKPDAHGNEWYVHADGSQSTTILGWREDLQRWSGTAVLATPAPVVEVR